MATSHFSSAEYLATIDTPTTGVRDGGSSLSPINRYEFTDKATSPLGILAVDVGVAAAIVLLVLLVMNFRIHVLQCPKHLRWPKPRRHSSSGDCSTRRRTTSTWSS